MSQIGAEPGRGDSAPGSRRLSVTEVTLFWQYLSIVRCFGVLSSGVSFLHRGTRFPFSWGMKCGGAGAPVSKGT